MAEREYHQKLVRTHIPRIIRMKGEKCGTRTIEKTEFFKALKDKLVEEAEEARNTENISDFLEELADLKEVILAIEQYVGYEEYIRNGLTGDSVEDHVEMLREMKHSHRGGFIAQDKSGCFLEWTER